MNFFATGRKSDSNGSRVVLIKSRSRLKIKRSVESFAARGWEMSGPALSKMKDDEFWAPMPSAAGLRVVRERTV